MDLKAVAQFADSSGLGTIGTSIFVGEMPAGCLAGILFLDRYSGTPINPDLPKYRVSGFRTAVRHADYEAGLTLAKRVNKAFTIFRETQMTGIRVKQMFPQNDPRPYRRSVGGNWEYEVAFDAWYVIDDANLLL